MRTSRSALIGFLLVCFLALGCASSSSQLKQPRALTQWPKGHSPQDVGEKIDENILPRLRITDGAAHYCEACLWVYTVRYADLTDDQELMDKVIGRFDATLTDERRKLISKSRQVDQVVWGIVPLGLYIQTGEQTYLDMGKPPADHQWESSDANGLSGETLLRLDDMYMMTLLRVQAYRATGDGTYLDRAALAMQACLDKLQRPNGLFYHAPDAPFFWGRANGWMAVAMTELLSELPANHARYERIMQAYMEMMSILLDYQGYDGTWRQLIDYPESFRESSATAMFTFAMINGVKRAWLTGKAYLRAARKGWLALSERIDAEGNLSGVCVETDKSDNLDYYLQRPRQSGDAYGQEALIRCIVALLQ